MLSLLLLLACTNSQPDDWWACEDANCRAERLEQAWQGDPDRLLASLAGFDELEQETLVRDLVQNHASDLAAICAGLDHGSPGLARCRQMESRPHLVLGERVQFAAATGTAQPVPSPLSLPSKVSADWRGAPHDPEVQTTILDCAGDNDCLSRATTRSAQAGQGIRVLHFCQARYSTEREFVSECVFQGAEAMVRARGGQGAHDAARLCSLADSFSAACAHHVLTMLVPEVTPADEPDPAIVTLAIDEIARIGDAVGPPIDEAWEGNLWSIWTYQAYMAAHSVTGRLTTMLPQAATPHLHAAAAYRMLRAEPAPWSNDLNALEALLAERLARSAGPVIPDDPKLPEPQPLLALWTVNLPFEDTISSVTCLDSGRRAYSEAPALDRRYAILEAAGRTSPPPPPYWLLTVVESEEHPWVRWTAARIFANLHPQQAVGTPRDSLPEIVTARLERGRAGGPSEQIPAPPPPAGGLKTAPPQTDGVDRAAPTPGPPTAARQPRAP